MAEEHLYEYKACLSCKRHPSYPEIPPITLHFQNKCLLCKDDAKSKIVVARQN